MGITQKALAFGVPVCVVPWARDQLDVAAHVVESGAGTRVPRRRLTARLAAAVEAARARTPAPPGSRRASRPPAPWSRRRPRWNACCPEAEKEDQYSALVPYSRRDESGEAIVRACPRARGRVLLRLVGRPGARRHADHASRRRLRVSRLSRSRALLHHSKAGRRSRHLHSAAHLRPRRRPPPAPASSPGWRGTLPTVSDDGRTYTPLPPPRPQVLRWDAGSRASDFESTVERLFTALLPRLDRSTSTSSAPEGSRTHRQGWASAASRPTTARGKIVIHLTDRAAPSTTLRSPRLRRPGSADTPAERQTAIHRRPPVPTSITRATRCAAGTYEPQPGLGLEVNAAADAGAAGGHVDRDQVHGGAPRPVDRGPARSNRARLDWMLGSPPADRSQRSQTSIPEALSSGLESADQQRLLLDEHQDTPLR